MSVASVTNGLGKRLKTHVNTELFEVIGNPLSNIEEPYLLILCTLHKFDTRYPEQCVAIAVNISDEDIILNKGMILCFVQETDLTMRTLHVKDMDTVNVMNSEDIVGTKRERLGKSLQEITLDSNKENCHDNVEKLTPIPENSAFMFHRDFYLKPRITIIISLQQSPWHALNSEHALTHHSNPYKVSCLRLFSDLMKCSESMKACLCSTSMFCKKRISNWNKNYPVRCRVVL